MPYYMYVNHTTNKARLHVDGGCEPVQRAARRLLGGRVATRMGSWYGPFATLEEAELRQKETKKKVRNRCRAGGCHEQFAAHVESPDPQTAERDG